MSEPPDTSTQIAPAWDAALLGFHRELQTRGASPHTLWAYSNDLSELAAWATRRGRKPGELAHRDLRTYAATLSERGLSPSSVARKLAAVRSLHDYLVRAGDAVQNPGELLPSPKRGSPLPPARGAGATLS